MEKYYLELDIRHGVVPISILRKSIKNIHLKVFSDLQVRLSVPQSADSEHIAKVLSSKKTWIIKQLEKYKESQGHNSLLDIKHGTSTQYLGKNVRILKKCALKEYVEIDEQTMYVYLKNVESAERFHQLIHTFWRKQAEQIFTKAMNDIYNKVLKKYNVAMPALHIRKMKTQWGSCTPRRNKITLNEYLLKADLQCIQYVVLHELTHLLYPHHNKDFYTFLTIHMPDWKARKQRLDKDVVQGL